MYQFTIPMALVDFLPVLFFGYGALLMQRDLYSKMGKGTFAIFAAGTINIFAAGFLKAVWKLLYAANLCDFHALNTMFLPMQSFGFLLAGIGIVLMLAKKTTPVCAAPVAPVLFTGSGIFIGMMVLGLGSICGVMSILAVRMKKKWTALLFIGSFLCSMGMGAMSGQDSTQAWVNWTEECINCVGQGLLLAGTLFLHRNGLKELDL